MVMSRAGFVDMRLSFKMAMFLDESCHGLQGDCVDLCDCLIVSGACEEQLLRSTDYT